MAEIEGFEMTDKEMDFIKDLEHLQNELNLLLIYQTERLLKITTGIQDNIEMQMEYQINQLFSKEFMKKSRKILISLESKIEKEFPNVQ